MTPFGDAVAGPPLYAGCVSKPLVESRLREALRAALLPAIRQLPPPVVRPARSFPARSSARILLAEDNPVNQEVALAILGQLGYTANAVSNGALAVAALREADYDIILMDCEMPEIDGYQATRLIRDPATGLRHPRIPIIAVTAAAMPGDREKCLRAGMDDYVSKPIEPKQIAATLAKWLAPCETPPVFDRPGLLQRLMGNQALAAKVLQSFVVDMPLQLDKLRRHLSDGHASDARRQAHTIKGAAANVSAESLRALALQVEQATRSTELNAAAALVPAIEHEFEKFKTAVRG
jgi:CheY-like chemotaxis protein/HPt (histidine-containing phosphotransfer) domain-containing protein